MSPMGLRDERDEAREDLRRERAKFNRKEDAREFARKRIAAAEERIAVREHNRSNVRNMDREQLIANLRRLIDGQDFDLNLRQRTDDELREALRRRITNHIKDDRREIENLQDQLKRLSRILGNTREDIRTIARRIRRLTKRIQAVPDVALNLAPGDPHWGGSAYIVMREMAPAEGVQPHSTKRTETYGNPGSDHHVSQVLAFAGDFRPDVNGAIRAAKAIGIGYNGYADDYKAYYITRAGHTFRVQIICANHGTGPHNHEGVERVN